MGNKGKWIKTIIFLLVVFFGAVIFADSTYALSSRFYGKYNECIAASGGRGDIEAVQQACTYAAVGNVNGCGLWIGGPNSHGIDKIYADKPSGDIAVVFWGLCTDRPDTPSVIWVSSIDCPPKSICPNDVGITAIKPFSSRPRIPAVSATSGVLNIETFIAGARVAGEDECSTTYSRDVFVGRAHSDLNSANDMPETITLVVPKGDGCEPVEEQDICPEWAPPFAIGETDMDEMNGTTAVDIRVRNIRYGKDYFRADTEADALYIMPTDELRWRICYWGGTPATANTRIQFINGDSVEPGVEPELYEHCASDIIDLDPSEAINEVGNELWPGPSLTTKAATLKVMPPWENKWDIHKWGSYKGGIRQDKYPLDIIGEGQEGYHPGSHDDEDPYSWGASTGRTTELLDAGETLDQYGETGKPSKVNIREYFYDDLLTDMSCPADVAEKHGIPESALSGLTCGCINRYELRDATVSVDSKLQMNHAFVKVPYNYHNFITVSLADINNYSGENTITVERVSTVTVPRQNDKTIAAYATIVPEWHAALYGFVVSEQQMENIASGVMDSGDACGVNETKQCYQFESWSSGQYGPLNPEGNLGGDEKVHLENANYNSFDASAGDYVCFVATVSSASVGDDEWMEKAGVGYYHSGPECRIIGKKPTFQVWGDSLYSVGSVSAKVGEKRNIFRSGNYIKSGGSPIYFGSWSEEALIIKDGFSSTVASGAATGINENSAGAGNIGGFLTNRSPLSFSNSGVAGVGAVGKSNIPPFGKERQEELIDYWATGTKTGTCTALGLPGEKRESGTGKVVCYVKRNEVNIGGGYVSGGGDKPAATYLIKSDGDVNIEGDIRYTGTYTMLGDIPKVVIFARNINISCKVTEVDAILLATGKVNTCSGHEGEDGEAEFAEGEKKVSTYNAEDRQTPLKIFGTVMTQTIELGRTYGAAANSGGMMDVRGSGLTSDGAAAEVFDYDSTILMWSEFMSGAQESDTLQTAYQHELAPRY